MSRRADRVAEAIRREASLLINEKVRDPRVGFVTVTKATISDDLRNAVIYCSVLGDEKSRKTAMKGLKSAMKFIRAEIGHRLELRYIPEIRVCEDDTLEYADRI
ncbi:MAG: 30S ribosome-binding factor RbfA, partial [Candidatus Omnitrophota bacterium]